jgi:hypothetical protein
MNFYWVHDVVGHEECSRNYLMVFDRNWKIGVIELLSLSWRKAFYGVVKLNFKHFFTIGDNFTLFDCRFLFDIIFLLIRRWGILLFIFLSLLLLLSHCQQLLKWGYSLIFLINIWLDYLHSRTVGSFVVLRARVSWRRLRPEIKCCEICSWLNWFGLSEIRIVIFQF